MLLGCERSFFHLVSFSTWIINALNRHLKGQKNGKDTSEQQLNKNITNHQSLVKEIGRLALKSVQI